MVVTGWGTLGKGNIHGIDVSYTWNWVGGNLCHKDSTHFAGELWKVCNTQEQEGVKWPKRGFCLRGCVLFCLNYRTWDLPQMLEQAWLCNCSFGLQFYRPKPSNSSSRHEAATATLQDPARLPSDEHLPNFCFKTIEIFALQCKLFSLESSAPNTLFPLFFFPH